MFNLTIPFNNTNITVPVEIHIPVLNISSFFENVNVTLQNVLQNVYADLEIAYQKMQNPYAISIDVMVTWIKFITPTRHMLFLLLFYMQTELICI